MTHDQVALVIVLGLAEPLLREAADEIDSLRESTKALTAERDWNVKGADAREVVLEARLAAAEVVVEAARRLRREIHGATPDYLNDALAGLPVAYTVEVGKKVVERNRKLLDRLATHDAKTATPANPEKSEIQPSSNVPRTNRDPNSEKSDWIQKSEWVDPILKDALSGKRKPPDLSSSEQEPPDWYKHKDGTCPECVNGLPDLNTAKQEGE